MTKPSNSPQKNQNVTLNLNPKNQSCPEKNSAPKKIIFLGNGPLADAALQVFLENPRFEVIFHAKTRSDLEKVRNLKESVPAAHAVLASFGSMIKPDLLELFEPEGILNIHPSKLPEYRGPSPIETAILDGATDFSVSVMKLAKAMDAGPIYYQETLKNLPLEKSVIYSALASAGARWIAENLDHLPAPNPQHDENATFTHKFEKKDGLLDPKTDSAETILRKIVAFQGFPKPKLEILDQTCIIFEAHLTKTGENSPLVIPCADGKSITIDILQPANRKKMTTQAFLNGYLDRK